MILCSYRAAQRYTARRLVQSALAGFEQDWPNFQVEIEEISDTQEILRYTPVLVHTSLVVNDRLVCRGRTPKKDEIRTWLEAAARELQTEIKG